MNSNNLTSKIIFITSIKTHFNIGVLCSFYLHLNFEINGLNISIKKPPTNVDKYKKKLQFN